MKPIINVPELTPDVYLISEAGLVYSKLKKKYLKGLINNYSYQLYRLKLIDGNFKWFMCHRLVALTYLDQPESLDLKINHKDGNKLNNHYTNLEWTTQSQIILNSYINQNRKPYWLNKHRPSTAVETKLLISNSKKKKIELYEWGKYITTYESVGSLCEDLSWSRKKYHRIKTGTNKKLVKRFTFKELTDKIDL